MKYIIDYEKQQLNELLKSDIYIELNRLAVEKGYECIPIIGDMYPGYLKLYKYKEARVLSVGLYLNGNIVTVDDDGEYDFAAIIMSKLKKGYIRLTPWEENEEFLSELRDLISELKNDNIL